MSPCVLSPIKPRKDGYVKVHLRGSQSEYQYAHRLAYEKSKGSIPNGLTIDHLCRTRNCVNPDHLEAVTLAENIRRIANVGTHHHDHEGRLNKRGYCQDCQNFYNRRYRLKLKGALDAPINEQS